MIAAVAALALESFKYERALRPHAPGPVLVVADGPMLAHAQPDFSDVRVVDANGDQVPWRTPPPVEPRRVTVRLLDVGRRNGVAVARFRNRGPVDRIELQIPDRRFVGHVTVLGSDDRKAWTTLSTTEIYSVRGAAPARSTAAILPASDFRWFELRATHVTRITGASVAARGENERLTKIPSTFREGVLDLRYRVPVEELHITAATPRYARRLLVETPAGRIIATAELLRAGPPKTTVVPLALRARRLRIVVHNGDNPPLRALRVTAFAHERTIVVAGGHPRPLRLYYGARIRPPEYDFARLPFGRETSPAALAPEHANPQFRVVDTRSFFAKHRSLVTLALALCAAAVIAAGALALRRA